jgi:4-hydroxy-tetrahydrodipicolinate reductase
MRLALVGYGKMGRMIEQLAPEYGFEVALILDIHNNASGQSITREQFRGIDVAIEFSTPEAAAKNATLLASAGVPVVIGTTGWLSEIEVVKAAVLEAGTAAVWSPNYSIGVNVFFRLVREASRLLAPQQDYGAWAWEIHHDQKKDAPSGTLLKLVQEMREAGFDRSIDASSNRAGRIPGTHEIGFDSAADTITLRHTARSREGFARGALLAARWVAGKKGFFEFSEILFQ